MRRAFGSVLLLALVGIIGTIQAAEALKLLVGIDTGLSARLLTLNALDMHIRNIALKRDAHCAVCHS